MFVESGKRILSNYMNKWMQNALPRININIFISMELHNYLQV